MFGNKICLIAVSAALLTSTSLFASVADIKNMGTAKSYQKTEELGGTSITRPGFITDEVGTSHWTPRLDLSNGTGSPAIDLSNSRGTNSEIGDEIINNTIAKGAWMELWVGNNAASISTKPLPATLKPRAILLDSKRYYPNSKTGQYTIPFQAKTSKCNSYLKFNADNKTIYVTGCRGPRVSYRHCTQVPTGPCTGNNCAGYPDYTTSCRTYYTNAQSKFSGLSVMY